MLLTQTQIKVFKSIEDSNSVAIDPSVTVFVGQNESGKTAFLQALYKARPIEPGIEYNVIEEYPRSKLNLYYPKIHTQSPDEVVLLTYTLDEREVNEINEAFGFSLLDQLHFTHAHTYARSSTIVTLDIPEKPYIRHILEQAALSAETHKHVSQANTLRDLITSLEAFDGNTEAISFLSLL